MTTTCQICGRAIQAKTGLIAHHGYKRRRVGHEQNIKTAQADAEYLQARLAAWKPAS